MQRDHSKLVRARNLRIAAKAVVFLAVGFLFNYLFYLVSGGDRELIPVGHYALLIIFGLFSLFFYLNSSAYKLEFPFLSSKG